MEDDESRKADAELMQSLKRPMKVGQKVVVVRDVYASQSGDAEPEIGMDELLASVGEIGEVVYDWDGTVDVRFEGKYTGRENGGVSCDRVFGCPSTHIREVS